MGTPSMPAYSRADRMSWAVLTGAPSSEKATQPAALWSAISVSRSPRRPAETAPIGWTRQAAASRARFKMRSVIELESFTGSVFAMQATAVKPPAAAARVPLSVSSLYSSPGSRR